jgi:peptide/nickel transport system substrate-binding protein
MDTLNTGQTSRIARLGRREFLRILALTGAAAGLTSACGTLAPATATPVAQRPIESATPKRGSTLRIGLSNEVRGIDPYGETSVADKSVYTAVYDGLVAFDRNLTVVPELAESWSTPDERTYLFHLRDGVRFHDGSVCDAEAVSQSFQWLLDASNPAQARPELSEVQDVQAADRLTVKFALKTPSAPLLSTLADRAGKVVSPTARAKYGQDFARHPVGTGPFQFSEWLPDDHLTLTRFDGYWDTRVPLLDRLTFRAIPDASVALTELKTGNIDFLQAVDPKDVAEIRSNPKLASLEGPGVNFWGIWPNTAKGPLASKPLREALSLAIDREAILAAANFGLGQLAPGPIPASSWAFDSNAPLVRRDLAKARAKLAEGGRPDGFDLKLSTSPPGKRTAELAQAQAKEAGIKIDIQLMEAGAFFAVVQSGQGEAHAIGWGGRTDPDGNVFPMFHSKGAWNGGKYANPEVDRLIEQGRAVTEREQRKQTYLAIQQLLNQDVAYIFTNFRPTLQAATTEVRGYEVMPDAVMRLKNCWRSAA